jgi:DNA replication protein DnaC
LWHEGVDIEFIGAFDLVRKFEKGQDAALTRYGDECEVLIIDDIATQYDQQDFAEGKESAKFASRVFGEILERRTRNDLRTVFTTNALDKFMNPWLGDRAFSRYQMRRTVVPVVGPDYRLKL